MKQKRAFTFTETLVAMLLIAVSSLMAMSLYTTAYDANKAANDTCFLELVQIGELEKLQQLMDEGGEIPASYNVETEAGRLLVRTHFIVDQWPSESGKLYYIVHATSRIGGTNSRKLSSTVIMTQQTGAMYAEYF